MISIAALTAINLSDAKAGDFFMPRETPSGRFLLGCVNSKYTVAVSLEGPSITFHDLPTLAGRRGFIIEKYDLLVDPSSSMAFRGQEDDTVPLGALVLYGRSVGLYAASKNNNRHLVALKGDQIPDDIRSGVAFTTWSISVRDEHDKAQDLFHFCLNIPPQEALGG